MEKTIREWFELLPTDIREKAIDNAAKECRLDEDKMPSLSTALLGAFTWSESRENHDYWSEIHFKAEQGEFK